MVIACLLLALPIQSFAVKPESDPMVYLNLGDSIAAGTGVDPDSSYYTLYSDYLEEGFGAIPVPNTSSYPGLDSSQLLLQLQTNPALRAAVSSADIITVSIGANNLLGPIIAAANTAYGLPMNTLPKS